MNPAPTSLFGVHESALSLHARRLELITSNLANADTPGYVAQDLDFRQALVAETSGGSVGSADSWRYGRYADQPSLDGNQVDLPREQTAFADAAMRYQASLNFLESRVRGLLTAITGQ